MPGHPGVYHCISRSCNRDFILGAPEKERFVWLMRAYEAFCGVKILTYCVMSNHFHLLVSIPPKPPGLDEMSDEELLRRCRFIYSQQAMAELEKTLEHIRGTGSEQYMKEFKLSFTRRMYDLSQFMKTLKQRFTQWYNGTHQHQGTIWESRFKSVLVEGKGNVLATMSLYIDLNPIRAGIVEDPKDYRWCGYAEALAGKAQALEGLRSVVGCDMSEIQRKSLSQKDVLAIYRMMLYGKGEVTGNLDPGEKDEITGKTARRGFSSEVSEAVWKAQGQLPKIDLMKHRVRYFTDGVALGTKEFLGEVFAQYRDRFGPKRKRAEVRMKGKGWGDMAAMRQTP